MALSVLDYEGAELPMRVLRRYDDTAAFNSQEGVVWRARSLNGALMLEHTSARDDQATGSGDAAEGEGGGAAGAGVGAAVAAGAVVRVRECRFRYRGAAALLAATAPAPAPLPVPPWAGPRRV